MLLGITGEHFPVKGIDGKEYMFVYADKTWECKVSERYSAYIYKGGASWYHGWYTIDEINYHASATNNPVRSARIAINKLIRKTRLK